MGADLYVVKPFSSAELMRQVDALLGTVLQRNNTDAES
jgi:DNA-binding response OmpR family regulator